MLAETNPSRRIAQKNMTSGLKQKGFTRRQDGDNLKPPPRRTIVNWILVSWNQLSSEIICKSLKACALTSAIDGSDDKDIHCFKEKQPCHAGLEMLAEQIELATGQEENPFQVDPDEIMEAAPQELIVDEDEEGDSGIDID